MGYDIKWGFCDSNCERVWVSRCQVEVVTSLSQAGSAFKLDKAASVLASLAWHATTRTLEYRFECWLYHDATNTVTVRVLLRVLSPGSVLVFTKLGQG